LTPYIVREQSDLRAVFERKMQERQEFLDHYFVFNDQTQYEPPKDYSRTNGLLEDIRASYAELSDRKHLEELTRPREVRTHEPGQPLELPAPVGGPAPGAPATPALAPGAAPATPPVGVSAPPAPSLPPPPPPTLNVAPPARNVERIER
jgi:general secretion pathway protein D